MLNHLALDRKLDAVANFWQFNARLKVAGFHEILPITGILPALGIETHVLAPDIPGAVENAELELPTQAWIHRVRYVGPQAGRADERLAETQGLARVGTQAALP